MDVKVEREQIASTNMLLFMKREIESKEKASQQWEKKAETDLNAKDAQIAHQLKLREENMKTLIDLRARWKEDLVDQARMREQERLEAIRAEEWRRRQNQVFGAAIVIQRWYRQCRAIKAAARAAAAAAKDAKKKKKAK